MLTALFSFTGISSSFGALLLLFTIFGSRSAPQQAAGAAMAIGLAIVPYVFSRCVQIISSETHRRQEHKELLQQLAAVEKAAACTNASRSDTTIEDDLRVN